MSTNRPSVTAHVNQSNGGIELALSAVLFGLVGWWLDRRLGTTPLLLLPFTLLGFVGAGLSLYFRYRAQIARLREEAAALRRAAAE